MQGVDMGGNGLREPRMERRNVSSAYMKGRAQHASLPPELNAWEELGDTDADEWVQTVPACAAALKKAYPRIHFDFTSLSEDAQIKSLAAALGDGVHMTISPQYIQGMIASPEAFAKGKAFIEKVLHQLFATAENLTMHGKKPSSMGAVIKENGEASIWTVQPPPEDSSFKKFWDMMNDDRMVRSYKEKGGRNVTEIKTKDGVIKFIFVKRLNYSSGSDIVRLAGLEKVGNVRSFIGGLQAYMHQVGSDRYLDEAEIKQAIAKMKGVIMRAGSKIQDLKEEEILKSIRRRAIEARNAERAEKLAAELRRRHTARKSREYSRGRDNLPMPALFDESKNELDRQLDGESCGNDMSGIAPVPEAVVIPVAVAVAAVPVTAEPAVVVSSVDVLA